MDTSQLQLQLQKLNKNADIDGGHLLLEIGQELKRAPGYEIICKIDTGGYSTVWQCKKLTSGDNLVAIKAMKCASWKMALSEIECLKIIRKAPPYFVSLLDYFFVAGDNGYHPCLVFEMLEGNLFDLMKKSESGKLPMSSVRTIAEQVLQGIDYLHTECGLVHADIKPGNILVCSGDELRVKIADFGSARSIYEDSDDIVVTKAYCSPEVILKSGYGPPMDVWSLACTLFVIATGDFLFLPKAGNGYSKDDHLLALMIQLLGDIPKRVWKIGKIGTDFFSSDSKLKNVDYLPPLTLSERLIKMYNWDMDSALAFDDFLRPMLEYHPCVRSSASECRCHCWLYLEL